MNRYSRPIALLGLTFIFASSSVFAGLRVNEVLVNEPSSIVNLEYFELYNDAQSAVGLSFYQVVVGADTVLLEGAGSLDAEQYLVVCRDSMIFVSFWVDNPDSIDFKIIERNFSLRNDSGTMDLLFGLTTLESRLKWPGAGNDGISWERVLPSGDSSAASLDPSGGTPGRQNSVARLPVDLRLADVAIADTPDGALLEFFVQNAGLTEVTDAGLGVYLYDPDVPDHRGNMLDSLTIPPTDTGFTTLVQTQISLPGYYRRLVASLSDDDRLENNTLDFFIPGQSFPPIVINEFLANPTGLLSSEWIELHNRSDSAFDITDWQIGDAISMRPISDSSLVMVPGSYLVLAQDTTNFLQFYFDFIGDLVRPASWGTLNNDQDSLRLDDPSGLAVDRFFYSRTYDSNFTWSRSQRVGMDDIWGRSAEPGGTPGDSNVVRIQPAATEVEMTIEPTVFSPDGNGFEDESTIEVIAPPASDYTLKIYDREGRVVRTFEDNSRDLRDAGVYLWDGRTDTGERLPIGIYIVYFEAGGVESVKKTVVVAR
jgi:hypothetical protein